MKHFLTLATMLCCFHAAFSQPEISTGYAVNKNEADGLPIQAAYDCKIKGRFYTKSQLGYKYLYRYNDFTGAKLRVSIAEFHQTLSLEVVRTRKYIFKPNAGINYRFYHWQGEMLPPLNTLPLRAWVIGVREGRFRLVSNSAESKKSYRTHNLGFSIQLQNQFRLNSRLWLLITPFIEPDYDGSQNTGGCYLGVAFKNF